MPEDAAKQISKRIRETIQRISAVWFEFSRLRDGFATGGPTIAFGGCT